MVRKRINPPGPPGEPPDGPKSEKKPAQVIKLVPATIGRPPKLILNDETRENLSKCGQSQCTYQELAAVLDVTPGALTQWFDRCPEARAIYEVSRLVGFSSLRRKQFEMAMTGNVTMLIWLGKQLLGQRDQNQTTYDVTPEASDSIQELRGILDAMRERVEKAGANGQQAQPSGSPRTIN